MTAWFKSTPEGERLLSEERLILEATESVYDAMDRSQLKKSDIASKLGVSKSEVGQRLSGRRNLTVRSLAAMLHTLGFEAKISIRPVTGAHSHPRDDLHQRRFRTTLDTKSSKYRRTRVNPEFNHPGDVGTAG